MASTDKGNRRGYMRYGYAAFGHKTGQGFNGNIYSGFGASNSVFCGTERAGKYPKKAAAGNSRRKSKWSTLRQTRKRTSAGVYIACKRVGKEKNHTPRNT